MAKGKQGRQKIYVYVSIGSQIITFRLRLPLNYTRRATGTATAHTYPRNGSKSNFIFPQKEVARAEVGCGRWVVGGKELLAVGKVGQLEGQAHTVDWQ